jgi:hypothetical protein
MVWVLFIIIASPGVMSGTWSAPVEAGEYGSLDECKAAVMVSVYSFRTPNWKKFDDGAICVPRPSRVKQ